jgi:UDP-glucuronate 4-epimerase
MRYLVTGGAGFIGSHLSEALLARGDEVVVVDNFNDYYTPQRKRRNLAALTRYTGLHLVEADFCDPQAMQAVFDTYQPQKVAHIGGLAGPRPSIKRPLLYQQVNVAGTLVLLEQACRHNVQAFVLASTSSVYGKTDKYPFVEDDPTDKPLSPYAATKKAAEVLSYAFHQLYGLPVSVTRFFTVYGPRGRPDMTPFLFMEPLLQGTPIRLFNGGVGVWRDWTYIDDIVAGVIAALDAALPYEIFNLGNAHPVELRAFVQALERVTGRRALIEAPPLPPTDPPLTFADVGKAQRLLRYQPKVSLDEGLSRFWEWYQSDVLAAEEVPR